MMTTDQLHQKCRYKRCSFSSAELKLFFCLDAKLSEGNIKRCMWLSVPKKSVTASDSQPRNMDHVSVCGIIDKNFTHQNQDRHVLTSQIVQESMHVYKLNFLVEADCVTVETQREVPAIQKAPKTVKRADAKVPFISDARKR